MKDFKNNYKIIHTFVQNNDKEIHLIKYQHSKILFILKIYSKYQIAIYKKLKKINHPSIPSIYWLEEYNDQLYIIEQFVNAPTLYDVCDAGKIDEAKAVNVILQLCQILNFLHSQTPVLVHRDITLKNILYLDHHIYLIDFDISRFYSSTKNNDTHIFGTRGYLAPEQYGYAQSSIASDIYQLGVIFNLLLTDFFPNEYMHQGKYAKVISSMLHLDPQKRPKNTLEVMKMINIIQCKEPIRNKTILKEIMFTLVSATIILILLYVFFTNIFGRKPFFLKLLLLFIYSIPIPIYQIIFFNENRIFPQQYNNVENKIHQVFIIIMILIFKLQSIIIMLNLFFK